jgi:tetratricopeptide (TPR) repeat protein
MGNAMTASGRTGMDSPPAAEKPHGLKARSATSSTRPEDFSVFDEAPVTRKPATCWGGWLLDFANPESRPPVLTVWDSDQESSCSSVPEQPSVVALDEEECTIQRLMHRGDMLESQGNLADAIVIYQRALELQRTIGPDRIGEIHLRTGVMQWKRGAYDESLSHLDQAIFAYQLHCDTTSDEDFCDVLLATGKVHLSRGDRSLAKKCFRHALSFLQKDGDDSDIPERAKHLYGKTMHALGMVYEAGGNLDKAVDHCQVALSTQTQALGNEQTDTAATLLSLGSLHEKKDQYELALSCFNEAYDIYSRLASNQSSSVDMGVALTSIGWMHYLKGNLQEALDIYNDVLSLFEPLGAHRNVAAVMIQMGMVYVAQGMDEQAAKIYKEALQIQRAVLGDDHEDVATTLIALGSTMERRGRLDKAVEFLDRALKIRRVVFGQKDLHLGETLLQLGDLHARARRKDSAYDCFTEALIIYKANQLEATDDRILRAEAALRGLS